MTKKFIKLLPVILLCVINGYAQKNQSNTVAKAPKIFMRSNRILFTQPACVSHECKLWFVRHESRRGGMILTDSSIVYAKKVLSAVANTGFTNYNLIAAKLLLDNYTNTNVDSAFKYSEIYRITNDSVFSAKAIQQMHLMTFESEKKQQELAQEKLKQQMNADKTLNTL
jgi:hypothetical protein